jgi:hypothetical protein
MVNMSAVPTPVEAVSQTAAPDPASLKEITGKLAQDVRPVVERLRPVIVQAQPIIERARRKADVFLPLVDEMRPLLDDLRPIVHDLRALLVLLLSRLVATATVVAARLDFGPLKSVGRIAGSGARRLAGMRPTLAVSLPSVAMPSLSLPSLSLPRAGHAAQVAPVVRAPSTGPNIGGAVHSLTRRLRPGRWAFRTVAMAIIAVPLVNPTLRDAMVDELNWTRSVLETVELPAIQIPAIEIPTIELPTITLPNIELPTFSLGRQEPAAASPKLTPAQFELPPLSAYRMAFESQASYPTAAPNATVEWVVALRNTGTAGWYRGVAGAQASLALRDGTEAAVQTTAYVAPGQVGWFVVHFRAPAGPGPHAVALLPRIDGRGELPDLGIFAMVTVR